MKNRNSTTKLLAMAIAVGALATIYASWGARPAQAIIIQGGKTGMFTLAQGEAVRAHVVNSGGEGAIIVIGGGIFDSEGNMLAEFPERRLAPGQATSFLEFMPPAGVERLPVRVELMVQGASDKSKGISFIPTCEVFDTATGKTSVGKDFIIVVGGG